MCDTHNLFSFGPRSIYPVCQDYRAVDDWTKSWSSSCLRAFSTGLDTVINGGRSWADVCSSQYRADKASCEHVHTHYITWLKELLSHINKRDDVCVHNHKFDRLIMKLCSSSSISSQHETSFFFVLIDSSTQIYLNLDYFNQWRTIWKENGVNVFSSRRWFWSVVICQTADRWIYLAAFWFWFLF